MNNVLKKGEHVYYEDYFGFKHDGTIIWVEKNGNFGVSSNPNTSMPQMDDSFRELNIKDEGKLFWFYPVPNHPVSIEEQMKRQV